MKFEISPLSSDHVTAGVQHLAAIPGVLALALYSLSLLISAGLAQDGPAGITTPIILPAFNADPPACAAPPGLRTTLVFAPAKRPQCVLRVRLGRSQASQHAGLA